MIVCAAVPPLWRRMMDHRVLGYYNGNVELIHTKATI
jgi:alkane 1-monooxygenase